MLATNLLRAAAERQLPPAWLLWNCGFGDLIIRCRAASPTSKASLQFPPFTALMLIFSGGPDIGIQAVENLAH